MKKTVLLLLLIQTYIYAQTFAGKDLDKNKLPQQFQEISASFNEGRQNDSVVFYPLNDNNFWEYIVTDTTVFLDYYEGLKYSVAKEVLGDTLMPNGLTYKILRWEKCGNSVNQEPTFECQRKDSTGKVFIYYDNEDILLYDFDKNVGDKYASQYEGYTWKVLKKYTVTGFGNQHAAIDIGLYDQDSAITRRTETLIEGFGLTYFAGDINLYSNVPEGSFFGGIINDTTYGELLAKRQEIDWSEFYPLHIGDFWKYEGNEGSFQTYTYRTVIKDTLLPDGQTYKMKKSEKYGGPYPGESSSFERFDSLSSSVMQWNASKGKAVPGYKFSACLGDTFSTTNTSSYFRFDDKSYDDIHYFLYPDLVFNGFYFTRGLGLTEQTIEGGGSYLIGAVIDGKVYGDTTVTSIDEEYDIPNNFELYQNYPNPFNPTTIIGYTIPTYSKIYLKIYDLLGREIKTLVDEEKAPGSYRVTFNAEGLASGVYIYTLKTNSFLSSKKLILLK